MTYSNILIVKLSAIGDVIHALPVAPALKKQFPQARITWVVEKTAYDLLVNNPYIDELILFEKTKYKTLSGFVGHAPRFINNLRKLHFDLAIDLQGLFKSSIISFLSGATTRLVYENSREGSHLLSRRIVGPHAAGHVVDRYLDVVRALGCQIEETVFPIVVTEREAVQARNIMTHAGLPEGTPYIVLALGANWPNKIWPAEYFAELCDCMQESGIAVPVIVGGPGDQPLQDRLVAKVQIPPISLVGKTTLKQLAFVIKNAQAFIGGDTGPMHLAAALATPTIALMGPTDAVRNGPYGQGHKALITAHECAGCWRRKCPGDKDCLAGIGVNTVYQALQEIMRR